MKFAESEGRRPPPHLQPNRAQADNCEVSCATQRACFNSARPLARGKRSMGCCDAVPSTEVLAGHREVPCADSTAQP